MTRDSAEVRPEAAPACVEAAQEQVVPVRREIVLETPFAALWYYPVERVVHHQIHRFIFGAAFRELLLAGAEVMTTRGATKWLSDDRNNGALGSEDKAWADREWSPALVRAGWSAWAIVQPAAVVGQMNMRRIAREHRALGVDVRIFTCPEAALAWVVAR